MDDVKERAEKVSTSEIKSEISELLHELEDSYKKINVLTKQVDDLKSIKQDHDKLLEQSK